MDTELRKLLSFDPQDSWQARVLRATRYEPIGMVVLSVLSHNFDDDLVGLLHVLYPGFQGIRTPFICSSAKINKHGAIVADVMWDDFVLPTKDETIFRDARQLEKHFRKLADKLKFSDDDRKALIDAAKKWVVADRRLDPTMDRNDPDARRLVLN